MGAYDYEFYKKQKSIFPVNLSEKTSMLDEMIGSTNIIPDLRPSFSNQLKSYFDILNDYTRQFNRVIFKITRLREDIYLFNTIIRNFNDNEMNTFTFAVNSRTLFNRFRVYEKDSIQPYPTRDVGVRDYINLILDPQNRVTLHFWKNEQELIKSNEILTSLNYQYHKYGLFDGIPITVTNHQSYNKRLLVEIMGKANDVNLLDFKNPASDSYFDDVLFNYYR